MLPTLDLAVRSGSPVTVGPGSPLTEVANVVVDALAELSVERGPVVPGAPGRSAGRVGR